MLYVVISVYLLHDSLGLSLNCPFSRDQANLTLSRTVQKVGASWFRVLVTCSATCMRKAEMMSP